MNPSIKPAVAGAEPVNEAVKHPPKRLVYTRGNKLNFALGSWFGGSNTLSKRQKTHLKKF